MKTPALNSSCPKLARHLRSEARADAIERVLLGALALVLIGTLMHQALTAREAMQAWPAVAEQPARQPASPA
jgi:hypothetical protein